MGKSNFLKTFSRGKISPYFQKVKLNIMLLLMAVSMSSITVSAQEEKEEIVPVIQEVTSSIPEIHEELSDINYKMDDIQILLAEDITQLQESNDKLETLVTISGYIFAAILIVIICIVFIAVYRLFNIFFRF